MGIVLANPWGLAALAAVPLLIAIHCLRQRSRSVRASTLFLLEHAAPRPVGGRRLERFRGSLPFWLQLAALLAATWLLVEPRWIRKESRQTVVVLLDGSISMEAFLGETKRALAAALRTLATSAGRTDWHLVETGPRRGSLHAGDRLDGLLAALERWRPTQGTHDPGPALALALSLAPPERGGAILVTDRPVEVPPGVALFSVATPIGNVGFTGADSTAEETADGSDSAPRASPVRRWRALVKNHGPSAATRSLSLFRGAMGGVPGERVGEPLALNLAPGETRALSGPWPAGADRLLLALDPDRFTADDVAPIERPVPRDVRVAPREGGEPRVAAMLAAADAVTVIGDPADADLVVGRLGDDVARHAVLLPALATEGSAEAPLDSAPIAATDHPLVRDLAWGGLLSASPVEIPTGAGDEVLVWKGRMPLVVLRTTILPDDAPRESLLLAFDLETSNAARLPALVVLLDRFAERVRRTIDRPWADTFQTEQSIPLSERAATMAVSPAAPPPGADDAAEEPFQGRAPRGASFFEVRDGGGAPLLSGAASLLDPREGDFAAAGSVDGIGAMRREGALRRSVADPFLPGWLALLAGALATAWWLQARPAATLPHPSPIGTPSPLPEPRP